MRLLLAEDDAILADALSSNLRAAGFEVEVADNGAVAEYLLLKQPFDLGVIDLGLPLVDGLTVLKRVHAARPTLPLLILTALDSLDSRVAGLNAGADDYLAKPFDLDELEARLRALERRAQGASGASAQADHDSFGTLRLDRASGAIYHLGLPMDFTPRERALMHALLARPGQAIAKERLYELVFPGEVDVKYEAIEVVVYRLRKKLSGTGMDLVTLRGLGYLLKPTPSGAAA